MKVAPFFVDFHHFLSIFTTFCRFSPFFIDFYDLRTFVAIYILSRFAHFFRKLLLAKIAFSATSHAFCMYGPCKTRLRILLLDLKKSEECEKVKENTNTYQMIFVIDFLWDPNECEGGLINWALPRYCDPDCIAIIQGNGLWKGNPFYFGKHPFQEIFPTTQFIGLFSHEILRRQP